MTTTTVVIDPERLRDRRRRQMPDTSADVFYPRDEDHRYRIYRLRHNFLKVMCTTPTSEGIGLALVTLAGEDEFTTSDAIGVLDVMAHPEEPGTGKWIINPYATGGLR